MVKHSLPHQNLCRENSGKEARTTRIRKKLKGNKQIVIYSKTRIQKSWRCIIRYAK